MEWFEVEVNGNRTCDFPDRSLPGYKQMLAKPANERGISDDYIGGIINHGKWGWLTCQHDDEATLLICDLSNGYRVAQYTFWRAGEKKVTDNQRCTIRCVEELFPLKSGGRSLLAICIQIGLNKSKIAIYTPSSSQVLRYILLDPGLLATSMTFLDESLCKRTAMLNFDGCLAVGTELGTVLMIDIDATNVVNTRNTNLCLPDASVLRTDILAMPFNILISPDRIKPHLQRAREQNMHLSLELDLFGQSKIFSSISSLLPLHIISGIAVGMKDGRIFIYDLHDCKLLKMWSPVGCEATESVERMCCIVPPDDPMPCFYLCAIYKKGVGLMTSLYSVIYGKSVVRSENEQIQLVNFQSVSTRMCVVLDESVCSLIDCNTASTFAFAGDNGTLLTAISWYSHTELKNKLVLFDINQWYKDEMPSYPRAHEKPNYLCGYVLRGRRTGLGLRLHTRTISPFIALHRCDEHFYPNSLSFDCVLLNITGCRRYEHVGIQRRFLDALYTQKANLFLNPQPYLQEMMRIRLMPQFSDYKAHDVLTQREMYEVIFSMVLEQDCVGLLNNCVKYCLDGSFLCNMLHRTRLTLATLTNWIVKRAGQIKSRCSELCQGIFDFGGYSLDERERDEYKELNRQLLVLQQLQARIISLSKTSLVAEQIEELQTTDNTLTTLYEFQRVLYWLIEQGLLPEGHASTTMDQQPLQLLRREYAERRGKLVQTGLKLFIDELLQHTSLNVALQDRCLEDGSYPPHSLQAFMHLMLLSDVKLVHKQELLFYMLLDVDQLSSADNRQLSQDFIRFFGIADSLVCSIKCFWLMDRGHFEEAIKALRDRAEEAVRLTDWQTKMMLEVLLANGEHKEALQLVYRPPGRITSELHLKVLLVNHNIPEAFHFARLYYDESGKSLLEFFFEHIIRTGKYTVLSSLCLREHEEQLVYRLLRQCKTRETDTVQLILLLKRCKYIEAVSFMDEVAAEQRRGPNAESLSVETSSILSAYRTTMAPVTQSIAGAYFRIRNNLSGDQLRNPAPEPFSCQLAKQNASGKLSNIFQSSALSAHWATRYRNEQQPPTLNSHNMPFLRIAAQAANQLPQRPRLVRPTPYQFVEKRMLQQNQRTGGTVQTAKRRRLMDNPLEEDESGFLKRIDAQVEQQPPEQTEVEVMLLQEPQLVRALLQAPVYLQFKTVHAQPIGQIQRLVPPPAILKRRTSLRIAEKTAAAAAAAAPTSVKTAVAAKASAVCELENFRLLTSVNEREHDDNAMDMSSEPEEQEEEEETDEIIVEIEQQSASPNPHLSPDHSNESVSDAEYVSPLPTTSASNNATNMVTKPLATPSGPQPRSSLFLGQSEQSSSGFGSFASVHMGNTHSLQLNAFVPPVCSSKVVDVPVSAAGQVRSTAITVGSTSMHVKISDRSTICVDADEPSVVTTSSMGRWSMPAAHTTATQPTQMPQTLRMLDTTLSMSSYDMTALEAAQEKEPEAKEKPETELETAAPPEQESEPAAVPEFHSQFEPLIVDQTANMMPMDYIELDDDEDEEQQLQAAEQEQQMDVEQDSDSSSEEETTARDYNQVSPSYSVSSELSELSEVASLLPSRQDAPVFSIVVESTNSITTSRSPTSHTPTSFLPSDTNVSQNSSPRAAHGVGGDGSNRSLYRANSLETVDDLDTTKGSLEEEEDNDEEDDCVIALDGTEVRGYVARPEPVAACSSAELFAFKQQHDPVEKATQLPSAAASLGATVNSDSVQAYTINLDSVDSTVEHDEAAQQLQPMTTQHALNAAASDPGTSNDSVATVAFSEHKQLLEAEPELQQEYIQTPEQATVTSSKILEHAVNLDSSQDVPAEIQINLEQDAPAMPEITEGLETPYIPDSDGRLPTCNQQTIDIDSDVEPSNSPSTKLFTGAEKNLELISEPINLDSVDSDVELAITESPQSADDLSQPLIVDSDAESNQSLKISESDNEDSEEQKLADQIKKFAPKKAVVHLQRILRSTSRTPPPVARSLRLRSDDLAREESLLTRNTPSPVYSQRRLRSCSQLSEASVISEDSTTTDAPRVAKTGKRVRRTSTTSTTTEGSEGNSPKSVGVARPVSEARRRLRSSDSQLSAVSEGSKSKTISRAGSLPPLSSVPVSTPKRRKRLLVKHMDVIEETAEFSPQPRAPSRSSKLAQFFSPVVDSDTAALPSQRRLRGRSEPPLIVKPPIKPKRQTKPSDDSATASGHNLRSRRHTPERSPSPTPSVPKVSEANVPPKKRGRPRK